MTRDEKQKHQLVSKKCQTCLKLSLGLVICLGLTKMVLTNRASTWGHDLYSIKQQTQAIKNQNLNLQSELAKSTGGLTQLSLEAEKQGFTDKPTYKYFQKGPSVAQALP